MKGLVRTSLLRRVEELQLILRSAGNASAVVDGRTVEIGVNGLAILVACSSPRTLEDLVASVSASSGRDFADLVATVMEMVEKGVLVSDAEPARLRRPSEWAVPEVHIDMLNDTARTSAFLRAVEDTVREGDVVVDIGTGTGVLAVRAAQVGARRVYAIEASAMAGQARSVVEANGVAAHVEVIRAWSTRASLPESANVLVTETLGNDPFAEHIVDIVFDAKKRLCTPDVRVVPGSFRVLAALVEIPAEVRDRVVFGERSASRWSSMYGVDFGPLATPPSKGHTASLRQIEAATLIELSEPHELATVDLQNGVMPAARTVRLLATRAGTLGGVMTFYEAALSPSVSISTRPSTSSATNSWSTCVWLEPAERRIDVGDEVVVRYPGLGPYLEVEVLGRSEK